MIVVARLCWFNIIVNGLNNKSFITEKLYNSKLTVYISVRTPLRFTHVFCICTTYYFGINYAYLNEMIPIFKPRVSQVLRFRISFFLKFPSTKSISRVVFRINYLIFQNSGYRDLPIVIW